MLLYVTLCFKLACSNLNNNDTNYNENLNLLLLYIYIQSKDIYSVRNVFRIKPKLIECPSCFEMMPYSLFKTD